VTYLPRVGDCSFLAMGAAFVRVVQFTLHLLMAQGPFFATAAVPTTATNVAPPGMKSRLRVVPVLAPHRQDYGAERIGSHPTPKAPGLSYHSPVKTSPPPYGDYPGASIW